jgi:type II secretory pathway component PulK
MNKIRNEKGSIAISMVITAVMILSPLMINFSYDSNINKLKVYNMEDRSKAKLSAESALQFAMVRLKLYQQAFNYLEENKSAKDIVKPETLDSIWNFPFIYPIPITKKMNAIQKESIGKFEEKTILDGSMRLLITNISNKMNLNMMRLSLLSDIQKKNQQKPDEAKPDEGDEEYNIESQLLKTLTDAIESKSQSDEDFNAKYYGMEIEPLINELKYSLSDPNSIEDKAGADDKYQDANLSPKSAPFASFSEMNALPGWPDDITDLIKNEFTIHGAIMIDLNKITDKLFKLLIPDASEEDIKEFFEYKNDPEDPKHFNSVEDFKKYIVSVGNIMNESDFTNRFAKFAAQGLNFGPTPTLFKVTSTSTVGRSTYNLTAYVVIPAQPKPKKPESTTPEKDTDGDGIKDSEDDDIDGDGIPNDEDDDIDGDGKKNTDVDKDDNKTLLLSPRIVEIIIG